jgi:ferritin-like metal-binding protein YciE
MTMALNTLRDLYIEELQDLYSAETQITEALPLMAEKASSPALKAAFQEHLQQTQVQVQRLEQIFQTLGEKPGGKTCKAMKGLVAEGQELMKEKADPDVMDAALIGAAQKVEHYEIASYGTARTFARHLGETQAATLLDETLQEEGDTDHKLTSLAEQFGINQDAMQQAA